MLRAIGFSTRRRRSSSSSNRRVQLPVSEGGAHINAANDDDSSTNLPAVAAAAAVAAAGNQPPVLQQNNDNEDDHDLRCPISLVYPRDPITLGDDNQVFSRQAISDWMDIRPQLPFNSGEHFRHPLNNAEYSPEELVAMIREVSGERLERIRARRREDEAEMFSVASVASAGGGNQQR